MQLLLAHVKVTSLRWHLQLRSPLAKAQRMLRLQLFGGHNTDHC